MYVWMHVDRIVNIMNDVPEKRFSSKPFIHPRRRSRAKAYLASSID